MTKESPRKHIDLSVLTFDQAEGLPYVPTKATDPEIISMRRSWPKGTVVLANQHAGAIYATEISQFNFKDRSAQTQALGLIANALVASAWHSYTENSKHIMRSVVDLPVLAHDPIREGDDARWRETYNGSLSRVRSGLYSTASSAYNLFHLHAEGDSSRRYESAQRTFSRNAASTAVRIAALGLLTDSEDERSAKEIQEDVWQIGLGLFDSARYAHESYGNHISLAQLADDPRESWLDSTVLPETRHAFDTVFNGLEE